MRIDIWKVLLFFCAILFMAYRIYPSHLEMATFLEKSGMYTTALSELNKGMKDNKDITAIKQFANLNEALGNTGPAIDYYKKITSLQPDNLDTHTNLIRIYQWGRKPGEVLKEYDRYLKILDRKRKLDKFQSEYRIEVLSKLKDIYSANGDWQNYINVGERLLALKKDNPSDYIQLINAYLNRKDIKRAIELTRQAKSVFHKNVEILEKYAYLSYLNNDVGVARESLKKLTSICPANRNYMADYVNILISAKDDSELSAVYKTAYLRYRYDLRIMPLFASYYINSKKYQQAVDIYLLLLKKHPDNVTLLKDLAYVYELNKEYGKSLKITLKLKEFYPGDMSISERTLSLYLNLKKYGEATKLVSELISKSPGNIKLLYTLARIYEDNSLPLEAAKTYEEILTKLPDDIRVIERLADNYQWGRNYGKSVFYFEKLIERKPDSIAYKESALNCYNNLKRYDKSMVLAKQLLKINPNSLNYTKELATIHLACKNLDEAYHLLKQLVISDLLNTDVLEELAWVCESLGKKEEAVYYYETLIQIKEPKEQWVVSLASLYMDMGNTRKAIMFFDQFLKKFPKSYNLRQYLADALISKNRYEEALGILNKLLSEVPNIKDRNKILIKMSSVLLARNEFIKAEKIYLSLYKDDPSNLNILKPLAEIYIALSDYGNAVKFYNYYVNIKKDDYAAHYNLSWLYDSMGDHINAREHARIALVNLKRMPPDVSLAKTYARVYQRLNKFSMALANYKKAISVEKDSVELYRDYAWFLISSGFPMFAIDVITNSGWKIQNDGQVQRYLAQAYVAVEDYDKALITLMDLTMKYPDDLDIKSDIAFVLNKKGRWDKSLQIYEDILKTKDYKWKRYKEIKEEAKNLKKTYGLNVKSGFALIDEIKKDTKMYYVQSETYMAYNLLVRSGFTRYFLHDANPSALGDVRETISETSVELEYFIDKYWSVQIGPFMANRGKFDILTFGFGITYYNQNDLLIKINYAFNDKELDPRGSVTLGGRSGHADFLINWDINDVFKVTAQGIHSEYSFEGAVRDYGLSTRPGTSDQFSIGFDINMFHDPRIALTYRYFWKDYKFDSDYNRFISYDGKIRSNRFGLLYDSRLSDKISVYGTAFVGNDSSRDMFIRNMGQYGAEVGIIAKPLDNFEAGLSYQFNYENGIGSQVGRSNYLNVYGKINF